MRTVFGFGAVIGLGVLALTAPASAKECVEPYGELVAVSDVESVVRIKPECMALAALASDETKAGVSLVSALLVEPSLTPPARVRPRLPDPVELTARPRAKRTVSCSDPAVCGTPRIAKAERPSRCEYGRAYAVGIADGLTEVRVYDDCRYLMNPQVATATVVPSILAPDWELDTSPPPAAPKRRRRVRPACDDAAACSEQPGVKAVPAKPGSTQRTTLRHRKDDRAIGAITLAGGNFLAVTNRRYARASDKPALSIVIV